MENTKKKKNENNFIKASNFS